MKAMAGSAPTLRLTLVLCLGFAACDDQGQRAGSVEDGSGGDAAEAAPDAGSVKDLSSAVDCGTGPEVAPLDVPPILVAECGPLERPTVEGDCEPVGPQSCRDGFVLEGDTGCAPLQYGCSQPRTVRDRDRCEPVGPAAACPSEAYAALLTSDDPGVVSVDPVAAAAGVTDAYATLSEAIAAGGQTLLVAPGTYALEATLATGEDLRVEGYCASRVTLQGTPAGATIAVTAGGEVVLSGLTFVGGSPAISVDGGSADVRDAVIHSGDGTWLVDANDASLTLERVVLGATVGSGARVTSGTVTLLGSAVEHLDVGLSGTGADIRVDRTRFEATQRRSVELDGGSLQVSASEFTAFHVVGILLRASAVGQVEECAFHSGIPEVGEGIDLGPTGMHVESQAEVSVVGGVFSSMPNGSGVAGQGHMTIAESTFDDLLVGARMWRTDPAATPTLDVDASSFRDMVWHGVLANGGDVRADRCVWSGGDPQSDITAPAAAGISVYVPPEAETSNLLNPNRLVVTRSAAHRLPRSLVTATRYDVAVERTLITDHEGWIPALYFQSGPYTHRVSDVTVLGASEGVVAGITEVAYEITNQELLVERNLWVNVGRSPLVAEQQRFNAYTASGVRTKATFRDNVVSGPFGILAKCAAGAECVFLRNRFHVDEGIYPVMTLNCTSIAPLTAPRVEQNVFSGPAQALRVHECNGPIIADNTFVDTALSAVVVCGGFDASLARNRASGVEVARGLASGIQLVLAHNARLEDNQIDGAEDTALALYGSSAEVVGGRYSGSLGGGVLAHDGSTLLLRGATIVGNANAGVACVDSEVTIEGGLIGWTGSAGGRGGAGVFARSGHVAISGAEFTMNAGLDVRLEGSTCEGHAMSGCAQPTTGYSDDDGQQACVDNAAPAGAALGQAPVIGRSLLEGISSCWLLD